MKKYGVAATYSSYPNTGKTICWVIGGLVLAAIAGALAHLLLLDTDAIGTF
ncbi:MAG TPA: hypothetical protein VFZ58_00315 [Candidatus Saccharimonadales bacterium]